MKLNFEFHLHPLMITTTLRVRLHKSTPILRKHQIDLLFH